MFRTITDVSLAIKEIDLKIELTGKEVELAKIACLRRPLLSAANATITSCLAMTVDSNDSKTAGLRDYGDKEAIRGNRRRKTAKKGCPGDF